MRRLLNQFIESVDGIEIYLIISLILFMGIFVLITIWALSLKKKDVEEMKNLPFDKQKITNQDINFKDYG